MKSKSEPILKRVKKVITKKTATPKKEVKTTKAVKKAEPKNVKKTVKKEVKKETRKVAEKPKAPEKPIGKHTKKQVEEPKKAIVQPKVKPEIKPQVKEAKVVVPAEGVVKHSKKQKAPKNKSVAPKNQKEIYTVGTFSNEVQASFANRKTEQEIEGELYRDLTKYWKDGEILWGHVNGIEKEPGSKDKFWFVVDYNGVQVHIPDGWFFEDNYTFGKNYQRMDDVHKMHVRRDNIAPNFINAMVCFCIKGVQRDTIENNAIFNGQKKIRAIASRKEAMEKLRDIYFFHRLKKDKSKPSREVKVGELIKDVHVIGTKFDSILVEALGYETMVDAYSLSTEYIKNCADFVKVGETISLTLNKLEIYDNKIQKFELSGRIRKAPKAIVDMRPGSTYGGFVTKVNKQKGNYSIALKNGVQATVKMERVIGYRELTVGDFVRVTVENVYEDFVAGKCFKQ